MLGSLADTGLDLVASLVVLLGVRIAAVPADRDHRFGHGKAEALAALVQVILISLSALFIGFRAVERLIDGARTTDAELGIGVSIVAMALTFALISYQRHVVRRTGSLAIGTDRLHYHLGPGAERLGDRRPGPRPVRRPGGRRRLVRAAHCPVALVGRLERVQPCARPTDGPGMAGRASRALPGGGQGLSRTGRAPRPPHAKQRHPLFRPIPCLGAGRMDRPGGP